MRKILRIAIFASSLINSLVVSADTDVLTQVLGAKFSIEAEARIQNMLMGDIDCAHFSKHGATSYRAENQSKRNSGLPLEESEIPNILLREIIRDHTSMLVKKRAISALGCSSSELTRNIINTIYNKAPLIALIAVDRQELLTSAKVTGLVNQDPEAAKKRLDKAPDVLNRIGSAYYSPEYATMEEREQKVRSYTNNLRQSALTATYRRSDKMKFETMYMDAWSDKSSSNFHIAKELLDKSGLSELKGIPVGPAPESKSSQRAGVWIRKARLEIPVGMKKTAFTRWAAKNGIETNTHRADKRDILVLLERIVDDKLQGCKQWHITVLIMLDKDLKQVDSHNVGIICRERHG